MNKIRYYRHFISSQMPLEGWSITFLPLADWPRLCWHPHLSFPRSVDSHACRENWLPPYKHDRIINMLKLALIFSTVLLSLPAAFAGGGSATCFNPKVEISAARAKAAPALVRLHGQGYVVTGAKLSTIFVDLS
jgi:hypothetical protein